ncbi:MAG: hypothetical protein AAB875_06090 [Patescibacteria group bacterium]
MYPQEIPVTLDENGLGTFIGWYWDYYGGLIFRTEEQTNSYSLLTKAFPGLRFKTFLIHCNQNNYNRLWKQLHEARTHSLKIAVSGLRFYKRGQKTQQGDPNVWITNKSTILYLDPLPVCLPKPKTWGIVLQHENGDFDLWNGHLGFRRTLEELRSDHDRVLLDDESVQWMYNHGYY